MSDVHRNVTRVIEAARTLGVHVVQRSYPQGAKTAQDAADAIGVGVGQIVKSLVFGVETGDPEAGLELVMAYVSGSNQLDEGKLAAAAGAAKCKRVDADAVRSATGYPIGGVPPVGHDHPMRIFIDPDLLQYDEVWAAAGTWNDVFGIAPDRLAAVTRGAITELRRD